MTTAGVYVVVMIGYSVVWSGQILRAINSVTQTYSGTSGYASYSVECESDIGKMKTQGIANPGLVTGSTGAIVSALVINKASTDINWNGAVDPSIISREGNQISYTITSGDMYDQFIALANNSGFDWRTRMQTVITSYSTWSSPTLTFGNAIGNYGAGNYAGKWVLFPVPTYNVVTLAFSFGGWNNGGNTVVAGDTVWETSGTGYGVVMQVTTTSGTWAAGTAAGTIVLMTTQTWTASQYFDDLVAGNYSAYITSITSTITTANQTGILSWAYCSGNASATALTLTSIQNQGMIPPASSRAVVLIGPVLDYAWSLEPPMPCLTLLANAASDPTTFQGLNFSDNSDYKSLATVVTVKGKTIVPTQGTGVGSTITSTLYAKDQWDGTYNFFKKSTYVTQRMDGYIYSFTGGTANVVLIGQGYALQGGSGTSGDSFYLYIPGYPGNPLGPYYITTGGVSTQTQADGTLTTTITATVNMGTASYNATRYSAFIAGKTYVADPAWLSTSYPQTCYIGSVTNNTRQFQASYTGASANATYGNYVTITASGQLGSNPIPAFPGTLISWTNPEPPNTQSPLAYYGSILYTQTVDSSITQSDLDVYASQYLVNKSYYLRKASVTAKLIMDYCAPGWRSQYQTYDPNMVREGNLITVLTSLNLSPGNDPNAKYPDGQYQNRWQVMSWTLDGSTMQVTCELGDYEKNTYTLMQQLTSSSNQTLT